MVTEVLDDVHKEVLNGNITAVELEWVNVYNSLVSIYSWLVL